jgi:microcin C transport system permease protein
MRLAWLCFCLLVLLYAISLGAELIANSNPLLVRFEGRNYFPIATFYPEDTFLKNGRHTRPDYKSLRQNPQFAENPANFMIFTPIPYSPYESVDPKSIALPDRVTLRLNPAPRLASINIGNNFEIIRSQLAGGFFGTDDVALQGLSLKDHYKTSPDLDRAIQDRFQNRPSPARTFVVYAKKDNEPIDVILSTFEPRAGPPQTVRLTLRQAPPRGAAQRLLVFNSKAQLESDPQRTWIALNHEEQELLLHLVEKRFESYQEAEHLALADGFFRVEATRNEVQFPHPPCPGHWLGLDNAGRDVLARILYGLRTSMTFGILLVVASMVLGTFAGAIQGYYGGFLDISAQRLIEIWSAIPFLYVMILLGSIYGRSFLLLLVCYGIFNWIGISYYMRAEFLRLRKQPFVEAAKCLGLPTHKILFRHILPNALVPIITFFPFSLVGAIGSLAALDYLGFGLPPPTASWGELLQQAQQYRWAWWLILYPALSLFTVMLLGVFTGEGVRNAFDPKPYARMR